MDARSCLSRPQERGPDSVEVDPGGDPREHAPLSGPLPPQRSIHSWLPHPSAVAEARELTRKILEVYEVEIAEDVIAVVSELFTNAVKASEPEWTVTLRLLVHEDAVLVAVADESDELPELREVDADETEGRGLLIVEALSAGECGYTLGLYGGKSVWAKIDRLCGRRRRRHCRCFWRHMSRWRRDVGDRRGGVSAQSR